MSSLLSEKTQEVPSRVIDMWLVFHGQLLPLTFFLPSNLLLATQNDEQVGL
jgi:hypothetical protein